MKHDLRRVFNLFDIPGTFVNAIPYGSGHINDTYSVDVDQAGTLVRYIFQRINHKIFNHPVQLMENISRVTTHLSNKLRHHVDASRRTLTVLPSRSGHAFVLDSGGLYWRAYVFIENARTYDAIESIEQAREAAKAFGLFQHQLNDLPGPPLHESIPDFHNTPKRFATLLESISADIHHRVDSAQEEIDFFLRHESDYYLLSNLVRDGKIPLRITHNDTKLNNVMIDDETGEGICVIDLDTVMPGLALHDFGDMVRTATSRSREDERDLSLVSMQMPMFSAIIRGYLESASAFLNSAEIEYLPFSGKLITLETGIRFLTDYLNGDIYFKTTRPGHNLDRCRTQCQLVRSLDQHRNAMVDEVMAVRQELRGRVLA